MGKALRLRRSPASGPPPSEAGAGAFPDGFRIALDPATRWVGGGALLLGGTPIRLLVLSASGRDLVDRLAAGEPVPPSPGARRLTRRLLDAGLAHPRPPVPLAPPGVAVVIPVRNDAGGLAATLAALDGGPAPTRPAGAVPVVVVDDASADPGSLETVCSKTEVTLLRRTAHGGPAATRNEGWRTTGEPLVAFVDADCEPEPGWLERLLPHFADPQVAAVAPRIVPLAGAAAPPRLAAYEAVASPLDLGPREAVVRPRGSVAYVPTAALVVRRAALEELGGFDETLSVGEDVDFVWRLVAAGWTVRYEPRATVRHPIRPNWPAWLAQRYRYGTSAAPLARRHGPAVAPAVVPLRTAAAWAALDLGRPFLGAAVAAGSVAATTARLSRGAPSRPGTARIRVREAVGLAGAGHLKGGLALARALGRAWPPLVLLLALAHRRSRPALAAAAVLPGLLEWADRRPRLDPVAFLAVRLLDDAAYAAGVWAGCVRERSGRALWPDMRIAGPGPARQTGDPGATIGGSR